MKDIDDMIEFIEENLGECKFDEDFNCKDCCELEYCYHKAAVKLAHEFAKNLDYHGYDSEEEFWENLD